MMVLYIVALLAIAIGVISLLEGIRAVKHLRTFRLQTRWRPSIAVFCPCKGLDEGFQKNVQSILDQDYPSFQAVFIVESERDPAFNELKSLGVTVLVAGEATTRGQKVHNLTHGVEQAGADADVFVFCDVDARFPCDWLKNLIAPLEDAAVGASTGYRWYVPTRGRPATLLRSIWNASVVTMLGAHTRNFVWGGSMAMRREVFNRIGIRRAWEGAVSDDYAVTRAVREAGMRIVFIPACLIPSYGDCSWRDLFEFTTRQIIITRVYEPRMWRMALVSQSIFNIAFWWSFALAWTNSLAAVFFITIYGLAAAKSWIRLNALGSVLPDTALSDYRWSYILWSPLSGLIYEYNLLRSAFTRDIVWRQIRYRLVSPHRTIVERGVES